MVQAAAEEPPVLVAGMCVPGVLSVWKAGTLLGWLPFQEVLGETISHLWLATDYQ